MVIIRSHAFSREEKAWFREAIINYTRDPYGRPCALSIIIPNTGISIPTANMEEGERKAVSEETQSGEEESSDSDGAPPENISLSQGREEAMKARRESARETKRLHNMSNKLSP